MERSHVVLLLTTVLVTGSLSYRVHAATKYNVCSLLTTAEVEPVLGTKEVRTIDGDMDIQGMTMSNCLWRAASPTPTVILYVARLPAGMQARDVAASASKQMEEIKQKGGTIQVAVNTPNLWCARIVPSGNDSPLAMCAGASKGYTVTLLVHHQTATGQQAKTLFDKAVARLS